MKIDLGEIRQFNPKLAEEIKDDPERLLALQKLIGERETHA